MRLRNFVVRPVRVDALRFLSHIAAEIRFKALQRFAPHCRPHSAGGIKAVKAQKLIAQKLGSRFGTAFFTLAQNSYFIMTHRHRFGLEHFKNLLRQIKVKLITFFV